MKISPHYGFILAVTITLAACGGKKGPIDQERSQLTSDGKKMTSEGESLIKEGQALQNRAKEARVVAASQRKQADILMAQGKNEEATQLRLQADQQDADAVSSENKGRDMEAQGLARIGDGQDSMNRSNSLQTQGEHIDKAR